MLIEKRLATVENEWGNRLFMHCQSLFKNSNIPSHNHWHHHRVWKNAKDYIERLYYSKGFFPDELIIQTIIACYFHDTGLTITVNENHGKASSELCAKFFKDNCIPLPEGFDILISAITNHEIKDEKIIDFNDQPLLHILSIADDIDAFGYVGIYRYTEIYLIRGINAIDLPQKVIGNIDKRFLRLKKSIQQVNIDITYYKKKYAVTRNFFSEHTASFDQIMTFIHLIEVEIIENKNEVVGTFQKYLENTSTSELNQVIENTLSEMTQIQNDSVERNVFHNELIIKENQLSGFAFLFLVFVMLFMFWPFYMVWGKNAVIYEVKNSISSLLLWLIPIIILHEGLHGLTWAVLSKAGIRNIKFGFNKEMLAPYTHCKVPLHKTIYLLGGIAPFIIMGVLPALISFYFGNAYWYTLALICIWTSAGDVLSTYKLLSVPNCFKIQDHPKKLGYYLVD
jgi:hypothetical protein